MNRTEQQVRVEGSVAYVPLSRGFEATIDAADLPLVAPLRWHALTTRGHVYAVRHCTVDGRRRSVLMHRLLMGAPADRQVDHINGVGTDNRRANLRLATAAENGHNRGAQRNNTSGFKGVSWHDGDQKWRAVIKIAGHQKFLGYFDDPADAHAAYAAAAKKHFGQFARVA